jgi:hypothetical protein
MNGGASSSDPGPRRGNRDAARGLLPASASEPPVQAGYGRHAGGAEAASPRICARRALHDRRRVFVSHDEARAVSAVGALAALGLVVGLTTAVPTAVVSKSYRSPTAA